MTQPLTDQRARAELVAELYDSHAAGLFAYCADQLGDHGSAADVLVTVLTSVPATAPPRAALYALARREIRRRDVVYAPPVVDPLIDPASALVERTLHELRPHHREVLLLSEVCGLDRAELAWVLDVAPDTAGELVSAAAHRYRRLLGAALDRAAARRMPKPVADVYGALGVAPLRDVLGRLPWPEPPGALRIHFAGSRSADAAPMFVRPRWPVPPVWPLPLGERDPLTSTGLFPAELLKPPSPSRVPPHEATTEPMPKVGDPLAATDRARPSTGLVRPWQAFTSARDQGLIPKPAERARPGVPGGLGASRDRARPGEPGGPGASRDRARPGESGEGARPGERPFFLPGGGDAFATGDVFPPTGGPRGRASSAPVPGDVLDDEQATQEMPAIRDAVRPGDPAAHGPSGPPSRTAGEGAPGSLFARRDRAAEPIYRMPLPADPAAGPAPSPTGPSTTGPSTTGLSPAAPSPTGPAVREAMSGGTVRDDRSWPAERDAERGRAGRSAKAREEAALTSRPGKDAQDGNDGKVGKVGAKPRSGKNGPADRPRSGTPAKPPRSGKKAPRKGARPRRGNRHHDWAWELIGFLMCVAIAMIVFFSVPAILSP
ncbi:hypothetical protein GCM10010149_00700 [Nonomuraea roseoviolacea subsp. roseoviolacea]|uniref:hypothetical protein n=1 Tax=Nonomuraea roseoviolacea TaxID=103837 RepID=UPI0031D8466D